MTYWSLRCWLYTTNLLPVNNLLHVCSSSSLFCTNSKWFWLPTKFWINTQASIVNGGHFSVYDSNSTSLEQSMTTRVIQAHSKKLESIMWWRKNSNEIFCLFISIENHVVCVPSPGGTYNVLVHYVDATLVPLHTMTRLQANQKNGLK